MCNLVSPEIAKAILAIPEKYIDLTEEECEKKFPDPPATTNMIRRMFWLEYDRAVETRMKMDMTRVYTGVCSRQAFYKNLQSIDFIAWMVCPPQEYLVQTEELLAIGLKQIRQILMLPVVGQFGVDTKLAEVKLKAVMMLDMRLKGAYVQRSMQYNHNVNENHNTNTNVSVDGNTDANLSIDEKIKQLEIEIEKTQSRVATNPTPSASILTQQSQRVEKTILEAEEADFIEVQKE